jgi:6-phosphogluconolactonase
VRVFEILAEQDLLAPDVIVRTHVFWGDERTVPHGHQESNVGAAMRAFLEPLGFPRENIHAPDGGQKNLEREAMAYEIEIKRHVRLGANGQPCFDLILLGMGSDGHTASLFPGTEALAARHRTFVLNEVPQLNTQRLTLTFDVLNAATYIVILVTGAEKAGVLAEIFAAGPDAPEPAYPIQRVRGTGENVLWLADDAALSQFTPDLIQRFQLQTLDGTS